MLRDISNDFVRMRFAAHMHKLAQFRPQLTGSIRTLQRCKLLGLAELPHDIVFCWFKKHVHMRRAAGQDHDDAMHALQLGDKCSADCSALERIQPHRRTGHRLVDPATKTRVFLLRRPMFVIAAGMNAMVACAKAALIAGDPLAVIVTDAMHQPRRQRQITSAGPAAMLMRHAKTITPGLTEEKTRIE